MIQKEIQSELYITQTDIPWKGVTDFNETIVHSVIHHDQNGVASPVLDQS